MLTCSASSSLVLAIHHAAAACSADDGGPDGFDMLMQFGCSSSDEVYGVAVNPTIGDTAVGDLTVGTLPGQTTAGCIDGFVRLYSSNGIQCWIRQFGSSGGIDRVRGVAVNSTTGDVAVVGETTTGTLRRQLRRLCRAV